MPHTSTRHALRRARELAGLPERRAARILGVPVANLRAWELGHVAPSSTQLDAAIALYGAGLDEVWAERTPVVSPTEPGVLFVGEERVALRGPSGTALDNRDVLRRYLKAVRRQRGVERDERVDLRATDVAALAEVLDLTDEDLEATLSELLDLTPAGSNWTMRTLFVSALVAIGATGLLPPPAVAAAVPGDPPAAGAPAASVEAPEPGAGGLVADREGQGPSPDAAGELVLLGPAPLESVTAPVSTTFLPAPLSTTEIELATFGSPFRLEPATNVLDARLSLFSVHPPVTSRRAANLFSVHPSGVRPDDAA